MLGWRRLRFTLLFSGGLGFLLGIPWESGPVSVMFEAMQLGMAGLLAFGLFEQWPRHLPAWLARWALQVAAVALVMPLACYGLFTLTTATGEPPFWAVVGRRNAFLSLTVLSVLLAPWVALAVLVRQREALVKDQALRFELERSELERQALDARLRLLQAQVAPHFLFNTLANIQALVDAGSPQAATVLRSLVAYLRAAVPRLHESDTTLGQELQLVTAYLELMRLRIPDRLQFSVEVDPAAHALRCPPMTLLTLVENAVRHGIDPSEEGGCIAISVQRHGDRCRVQVCDTGVGLGQPGNGLGTGLATLQERLALAFAGDAKLCVQAQPSQGVCAELDFPAHWADKQ